MTATARRKAAAEALSQDEARKMVETMAAHYSVKAQTLAALKARVGFRDDELQLIGAYWKRYRAESKA